MQAWQLAGDDAQTAIMVLLFSHRPSVKSVAANESSPVRTTGG